MKQIALSFFLVAAPATADTYLYQTLPGTTVRDFSRPGLAIQGNQIFPTIPGTTVRDYSQQGATIQGPNIYPTIPGTTVRDYSQPGWRLSD